MRKSVKMERGSQPGTDDMEDTPSKVTRPVAPSAQPARRRGRPPGGKGSRDTSQVQAIRRALSLLELMAQIPGGMALTALAKGLGLPPSTTHRLLKSLEQMRFVQHEEERGLWLIGVRAFCVGIAFLQARDFVSAARPFMRRLMEESGESVNLAILDNDTAVLLSQVECRQVMRGALERPGGRVPLHNSGFGKALLSALRESDLAALLDRIEFTVYTENTIDSADRLKRDLVSVRRRGYAVDDEEFVPGLRCVAAVIHGEYGESLASISLSGPAARITDDRIDDLGALVVRTAGEITTALGGDVPRLAGGRGG